MHRIPREGRPWQLYKKWRRAENTQEILQQIITQAISTISEDGTAKLHFVQHLRHDDRRCRNRTQNSIPVSLSPEDLVLPDQYKTTTMTKNFFYMFRVLGAGVVVASSFSLPQSPTRMKAPHSSTWSSSSLSLFHMGPTLLPPSPPHPPCSSRSYSSQKFHVFLG